MTVAWQMRSGLLALAVALLGGCQDDAPASWPCNQVVALDTDSFSTGVLQADGQLWMIPDPRGYSSAGFAPELTVDGTFCLRRTPNGPPWCPLADLSLPAHTTTASVGEWSFDEPPVACAVLDDGTLTCQHYGKDLGIRVDHVATVAIGRDDHFCATNTSGAVFCRSLTAPASQGATRWDLPAGTFPELDGIVQMVTTRDGFCGRKKDGSVWCWGEDFQPGASAINGSNRIVGLDGPVKALAAVQSTVCALREDGAVLCWSNDQNEQVLPGDDRAGFPQQITGLPMPATAIAIHQLRACALVVDGTVWCWDSLEDGSVVGAGGPSRLAGCGP